MLSIFGERRSGISFFRLGFLSGDTAAASNAASFFA
jgi:hypothetical protein